VSGKSIGRKTEKLLGAFLSGTQIGDSQYREKDSWKSHRIRHSPRILTAIVEAVDTSDSDIQVHISKKWWEKNVRRSARQVFREFKMNRSKNQNSVLIYINPRLKKFSITIDQGLLKKVGPKYLDELSTLFRTDLQSTYLDNAIAMTVNTVGATLSKYYPKKKPKKSSKSE